MHDGSNNRNHITTAHNQTTATALRLGIFKTTATACYDDAVAVVMIYYSLFCLETTIISSEAATSSLIDIQHLIHSLSKELDDREGSW